MKSIKYIVAILTTMLTFSQCELSDELQVDAGIYGSIYDLDGNIVPSDVTTKNLVVNVLGEEDLSPINIPVKGDGTYKNQKLYPQKYKVWLEGPIVHSDTLHVGLSAGNEIQQDFNINPYLRINLSLNTASGNTAILNYEVIENTNLAINSIEAYCSTVMYPVASIGSGAFYETKKIVLEDKNGQIKFEDLDTDETYYIRIGANVKGQLMNYSNQVTVNN